jgi:LmbE family N-acetylglucosaminyl deacetylase
MTTAAAAREQMYSQPLAPLREFTGDDDVLVLAPHADDEVLGCGGLICEALALGRAPAIVIVTDGSGSHPRSQRYPRPRLIALRQAEAREAAAILGVASGRIRFLGLPDTAAPIAGPAFDRAVEAIVCLACELGCRTLCATWEFDPHCDHLAVARMAKAASAILQCRHLSYPVWGWTLPDDTELGEIVLSGWRLPVAAHQGMKDRALRAHSSQLTDIIDDDPEGFQLTASALAQMTHPFEVFLADP